MSRSKYNGMFTKNQVIGSWIVIDPVPTLDKRGRAYITCKCQGCSTKKQVSCTHISKNQSTQCANCNKSHRAGNLNPNWKGSGEVSQTFLSTISSSAAKSDSVYTLTSAIANDLLISCNSACQLTGQAIMPGETGTLILKEPDIGYIPTNVMWVHTEVAAHVNNTPVNEFVQMAIEIAKKYQPKEQV